MTNTHHFNSKRKTAQTESCNPKCKINLFLKGLKKNCCSIKISTLQLCSHATFLTVPIQVKITFEKNSVHSNLKWFLWTSVFSSKEEKYATLNIVYHLF